MKILTYKNILQFCAIIAFSNTLDAMTNGIMLGSEHQHNEVVQVALRQVKDACHDLSLPVLKDKRLVV